MVGCRGAENGHLINDKGKTSSGVVTFCERVELVDCEMEVPKGTWKKLAGKVVVEEV